MIVLRTHNSNLKVISNAKLGFPLNIGSLVTCKIESSDMKSPEFNDVIHNSPINTLSFKTKVKTKHGPSYPTSPKFQVFRCKILHFMERVTMCCPNRRSGVYSLNQGHMTWLALL